MKSHLQVGTWKSTVFIWQVINNERLRLWRGWTQLQGLMISVVEWPDLWYRWSGSFFPSGCPLRSWWSRTHKQRGGGHRHLPKQHDQQANYCTNVPISHANVTKLDSELISSEDHTNEFYIISIEWKIKYCNWNCSEHHLRNHTIRKTSSYNTFNIAAGCGIWLHSASDGSRERCKIREVRVNVNGVEDSRYFRVGFVGQRSIKDSANIGSIQWVAVGERGSQTLSHSVALRISQDRIALWIMSWFRTRYHRRWKHCDRRSCPWRRPGIERRK